MWIFYTESVAAVHSGTRSAGYQAFVTTNCLHRSKENKENTLNTSLICLFKDHTKRNKQRRGATGSPRVKDVVLTVSGERTARLLR